MPYELQRRVDEGQQTDGNDVPDKETPMSIRRTGRIEKQARETEQGGEARSPVLLVAVELPPVPVLVAGHDEERQQGEGPRPGAQRGPRPVQEVLGAPPPQHGAHRAGSPAGSVAARALRRCGHGDGLLDVGHGGCAGVSGASSSGIGKETEMVLGSGLLGSVVASVDSVGS